MTQKKAQKVITKKHKKQAKKAMDTFFLRCKTEAILTPTQGFTVSNYIYQTHTLSPVNPSALTYMKNAEFNLYRIQYDKFRVNSVHVKVIPKANMLQQTSGQNAAQYNVNGDGMWHTAIDRDSNGPNSVAQLSRYPSYQRFDVKKPWSRTYSVKYPVGVWIDCQSPGTFEADKSLGLQGGITMYGEQFLEDQGEILNEPVAAIEVYYNIVFSGKTSASLSGVYADGQLVGMQIINNDQYTPAPQTVPQGIRGSLDDKLLLDTEGVLATQEIPFPDRVDADATA